MDIKKFYRPKIPYTQFNIKPESDMNISREEFLKEFLGALGAIDVSWHEELENYF